MKLCLIYYKCLVDLAFQKFVQAYGDFFTKVGSKYVLGLNATKQKMESCLSQCIDMSIEQVLKDASIKDGILLVIGACYPKDNLLLKFKDDCYFPSKLAKAIEQKPAVKWLLAEPDIEVDIDLLNEVFNSIFNKRFRSCSAKRSAAFSQKAIYVSHSSLDCYMVFKTVKWAYGSSNCINLWKEVLKDRQQNIIALNDLVSKYIHNKSRMNKSQEFKKCALEVKDYLDGKLSLKR